MSKNLLWKWNNNRKENIHISVLNSKFAYTYTIIIITFKYPIIITIK